MSVSATLQLPSQPTLGELTYTPLGGDGLLAPFAAHVVNGFRVVGDASGGNATLEVLLDTRFCHIVAFVATQITQATSADADVRYSSGSSDRAATQVHGIVVPALSALINAATIANTWNPAPQVLSGLDAPNIRLGFVNVDTDTYFLEALIYLFRLDVREKTPMGPLLWARGAT